MPATLLFFNGKKLVIQTKLRKRKMKEGEHYYITIPSQFGRELYNKSVKVTVEVAEE